LPSNSCIGRAPPDFPESPGTLTAGPVRYSTSVSGQLLLPTIRESRVRASPRSRRILFRFGLDLRRRRTRRAILQAGLLESLQELFHLFFVRIPHLYILTDIFKVEKRWV